MRTGKGIVAPSSSNVPLLIQAPQSQSTCACALTGLVQNEDDELAGALDAPRRYQLMYPPPTIVVAVLSSSARRRAAVRRTWMAQARRQAGGGDSVQVRRVATRVEEASRAYESGPSSWAQEPQYKTACGVGLS